MNNTIFKNVSNMSDEAYEKYPVSFHISRIGVILTGEGAIMRSIAEEFGLKLISCDYGADSDMYGFNPRMANFIDMLSDKYGDVEYYEDTLGFTLNLMFEVNGKECIYYIGTGNNGQEVSLGVHLESLDTLDTREFRDILRGLDEEMLGYIEECCLDRYC